MSTAMHRSQPEQPQEAPTAGGPVVDVRDFGSIGDADDTAALRKAFEAATPRGAWPVDAIASLGPGDELAIEGGVYEFEGGQRMRVTAGRIVGGAVLPVFTRAT